MTPHEFEQDPAGVADLDCRHCTVPKGHAIHVTSSSVPTTRSDGKRSFNLLSKDEGMELAATSRASEEFRRTFFLAMAEVATRQQYVTTNDAWDLLESRGYRRSGSAQATGTIGPSGASIGLWDRTEQTALNTSGNLHSSDNGVRVYESRIVGKDFETDVVPLVLEKARALAEKAAKREQEEAEEAYAAVVPEGSERHEEYRVVGAVVNEEVVEVIYAISERNAQTVLARYGGTLQVRTVIETPWVDHPK